jgi:C-terminal processing protease CtpA/Prc
MAFQVAPKARVFGSQTAGADGNVSEIILPGGFKTYMTGIGVYYPDGTETQQIGIRIDEPVKPTIQSFREGRDIVLEKALEYLK